MDIALDLLNKMKTSTYLKPDVITFNTLIKGCSIIKNLNLGEQIMSEM